MLQRLYTILNAIYQRKIIFSSPLVVLCKPMQCIDSITKVPCGYSVLVEVAGHCTPVHINKLRAEAVQVIVERLAPVQIRVIDKVSDACVNVYSQIFLS